MEITLPELIDRITILELKIERLNAPYIKDELLECQKALAKFKERKIEIKDEWFKILKEVNGKIWDLEFEVREIMDADDVWKAAEEKFGFENLGKRAQTIAKLVIDRANIKNEIAQNTGQGFKEVKTDYCGQK